MTHTFYVTAAYLLSALALGGLAAFLLVDKFGRRRELAELERRGIRRRSEQG